MPIARSSGSNTGSRKICWRSARLQHWKLGHQCALGAVLHAPGWGSHRLDGRPRFLLGRPKRLEPIKDKYTLDIGTVVAYSAAESATSISIPPDVPEAVVRPTSSHCALPTKWCAPVAQAITASSPTGLRCRSHCSTRREAGTTRLRAQTRSPLPNPFEKRPDPFFGGGRLGRGSG